MINHVRTLLLNRSGGKQNLTLPGEEYIPETFQSQKLPQWLQNYLNVLFGSEPEIIYQNYVVEKLLKFINSTDFKNYVYFFDPRITYNLDNQSDFFHLNNDLNIEGSLNASIDIVSGTLQPNYVKGILFREWAINISSGFLTIKNIRTNEKFENIIYIAQHLSLPFPLPGTDVQVRVTLPVIDLFSWNFNGRIWNYSKFTKDFSEIISDLENLRGNLFKLFGRDGKEPYKTFFNLWNSSNLAEKITGFVLALAWRLEENRLNNVR